MIGETAIEVGLQKREGSLLVEKVVRIALSHIVKLEAHWEHCERERLNV